MESPSLKRALSPSLSLSPSPVILPDRPVCRVGCGIQLNQPKIRIPAIFDFSKRYLRPTPTFCSALRNLLKNGTSGGYRLIGRKTNTVNSCSLSPLLSFSLSFSFSLYSRRSFFHARRYKTRFTRAIRRRGREVERKYARRNSAWILQAHVAFSPLLLPQRSLSFNSAGSALRGGEGRKRAGLYRARGRTAVAPSVSDNRQDAPGVSRDSLARHQVCHARPGLLLLAIKRIIGTA